MKKLLTKLLLLCTMSLCALGVSAEPDKNYLCITANVAGTTVSMNMGISEGYDYYYTKDSHLEDSVSIEYSTDDGATWHDMSIFLGHYSYETGSELWNEGNIITLENVGDKVYFRNKYEAKDVKSFSCERYKISFIIGPDYNGIHAEGSATASGNIMSLVDKNCETLVIPSDYCFSSLFWQTYLTSVEDLLMPATTLKPWCYEAMFTECKKLTKSVRELPATKMEPGCYACMFWYCYALTTTPPLPAMKMEENCYYSMFRNCSALTKAPDLPATELAPSCYELMFERCGQLTVAPHLPAEHLEEFCYGFMFADCKKLQYISVNFTDWNEALTGVFNDEYATFEWVTGVSKTGTFVCPEDLEHTNFHKTFVPLNSTYHWTVMHPAEYLSFTANTDGTTVKLLKNGSPTAVSLEYSSTAEDDTWIDYTIGDVITLVNEGDKIYFRNKSEAITGFSTSASDYYQFDLGGSVSVGGSVTTLVEKTGFTREVPCAYCFYKLFEGCTEMTTAPKLRYTSLKPYCYSNMFSGCTGITSAPVLIATEMQEGCYSSIYKGCTGITEAPELPADTLAVGCYESMFEGCTKITSAPKLIATTLPANSLKGMFKGCSSLNYINVAFTDWNSSNNATTDWVDGVAESGTFFCPEDLFIVEGEEVDPTFGPSNVPLSTEHPWMINLHRDYLCMTAQADGVKIALHDSYSERQVWIQYSTDEGITWNDIKLLHEHYDSEQIVLNKGEKVFFRTGEDEITPLSDEHNHVRFSISKEVVVSGNVMSLVDKTCKTLEIPAPYCFYGLFSGCDYGLLSTPELPATKLTPHCYEQMFSNCRNLKTATEILPATELEESCYEQMFNYCMDLNVAPKLPATKLAKNCYKMMFNYCYYLLETPDLPATELAESCYESMFQNCATLKTSHALPATKLAKNCYRDMFMNQYYPKFTTVPDLPATELAESCYEEMFQGCYGITSVPEYLLPATKMEKACYKSMFNGCDELKNAPALPATELADACYQYMFAGCEKLTKAPYLPATELKNECYSGMFFLCYDLQDISVEFKEWDQEGVTEATYEWVAHVSRTGTFSCPKELDVTVFGEDRVPYDDDYKWIVKNADFLCFAAVEDGATVELTMVGSPTANSFQYSTDKGANWTDISFQGTPTGAITLAKAGDKVFFRNAASAKDVTGFSVDADNYYHFELTGTVAASGNVMSLVDSEYTSRTIPVSYGFYRLFGDCTGLTSAPSIPADTLTANCYQAMFSGCTGLTSAPALPAKKLAANCYQDMFNGCVGLTSAPALPAKKLAANCYQAMFSGCTGLTSAPDLMAETLPAGCYQDMFNGCTEMNYIKVAFKDWNSSNGATTGWVTGVAEEGLFICPDELDISTFGANNIPLDNDKRWIVKYLFIPGQTFNLNVTDAGWASMYVNRPLSIPSGAEVFYSNESEGNKLVLVKIYDKIAPRTAVVVRAAKGTVKFPIIDEELDPVTDNILEGKLTDSPCQELENYVLDITRSTPKKGVFSLYKNTTLHANKAYLPKSKVTTDSNEIKFFADVFDEEADAIENIGMGDSKGVIHNLMGTRVGDDYHGIIIKNGKKMLNY